VRANGKITGGDLKLADAVRALAPPGGSALVADVAARMRKPVADVLKAADAALSHGVGHRYAYQGMTYVALSNEGWELGRAR
jgi:hypothetical protein